MANGTILKPISKSDIALTVTTFSGTTNDYGAIIIPNSAKVSGKQVVNCAVTTPSDANARIAIWFRYDPVNEYIKVLNWINLSSVNSKNVTITLYWF